MLLPSGQKVAQATRRDQQIATTAVNGRHLGCKNCGTYGHTTADCTKETRGASMATRPLTQMNTSVAVTMAILMSSGAAGTTYATLWPINTPSTQFKVDSPTIKITVTPRGGLEANVDAITDTGATVSARPGDLASRFGRPKERVAVKARQPLSLIGVGQEETRQYIEGTLRIGDTEPSTVRLWIALISLSKVLIGNDALSKIARIEMEYGNLRRFQVATATNESKDTMPKMKPDLVKKAVHHT